MVAWHLATVEGFRHRAKATIHIVNGNSERRRGEKLGIHQMVSMSRTRQEERDVKARSVATSQVNEPWFMTPCVFSTASSCVV